MALDLYLTVRQFVTDKHLLDSDGKYLVALSGGADSVTLLLVLKQLGYEVEACHCNFHLRGKESDRDEQFCVDLCERIGVPLHRIHFDTHTYAELHKVSIEMAARDLRYHYFEQLMEAVDADGICVAHHQDDSVETLLINLLRGTGIEGMTGISPKNGHIIRPLLCVSRADILHYLEERKQDFVTDSSNLVPDVVRNKVRLQVIPLLKQICPAAVENIAKTAHYLDEANEALATIRNMATGNLEGAVSKDCYGGMIRIRKSWVKDSESPAFYLHAAIGRFGFSGPIIENILASIDTIGKRWETDTYQLVIDREHILVKPKDEADFQAHTFPEDGNYVLPKQTVYMEWKEDSPVSYTDFVEAADKEQKVSISIENRDEEFKPSKQAYMVTLDADKVTFPLTLRRTRTGDRFQPFGMKKGSKLVSDFLTDEKQNLFYKEAQCVLTDKEDNILWVVGKRSSERCKVTTDTTRILRIKIQQV